MKINITLEKLNKLQEKISILDKYDVNVLTEHGFKKVKAIGITSPDSIKIIIKTKEFELSGSPLHRVKYLDKWIFLKDIKIGDSINTRNGTQEIIFVKEDLLKEDLWDIEVEGSEYYSNGILSHNSSIQESIDYVLFKSVKGKKKKWTTLSTLPNRINGELLNRIKLVSNNVEVEIKRGINPNILELWENGVLNERAGKSNIDDKIENYIGMDVDTFKSFISISINDFKNFISLSNEEKQILLDKLFNLEIINILNDILKGLVKTNKQKIILLDNEISTLEDSIERIQDSINKSIEKQKENLDNEIDDLKAQIESKKNDFIEAKSKIDKISEKDDELRVLIDKDKKELILLSQECKSIQKEIDLYDSGKCPTCSSDFNQSYFSDLKTSLIEKLSTTNKLRDEVDDNIKSLKEKQTKLNDISEKWNKIYNDINYFLKNCKSQIDKLNSKKKSSLEVDDSTYEFQKSINDLSEKKSLSESNKSLQKDKELYYKEISKIFGEDGVKKSIIDSIIKPINHFISENIKIMKMPFEVVLDDTFTACIKSMGEVIDPETLSTGETRRINICILVSYLKLIKTKKTINLLFLDEVFSSIDLSGIEDILILLKTFALDYNTTIFVVHHAIMNEENFDRILKINKDVFSTIEEVNYV
jgi:DNA repair exonuclease SbcCD ATPase subunit